LKVSITVTLKKDVLDPQGKVVKQTLENMGYSKIQSVRQGKYFEIEVEESDEENIRKTVDEICKKLLTNTVIEDYKINYN
jgi:phosphoribosylformylglycinamidine synthase PurS subunit